MNNYNINIICYLNIYLLFVNIIFKYIILKYMNYLSYYMEIREGLGGKDSIIFVKNLYDLYKKLFNSLNIMYEIISFKKTIAGFKRILLFIRGKNIKFIVSETGIHRIQRIPVTEKNGRVHTSTCIVEIIELRKLNNIIINKGDLKISTFKSSGAGGQHVNKTNTAVRIKHTPTGISVECQKERSQLKNKETALNILISKIDNYYLCNNQIVSRINRKEKLKGVYNKSNKVRTYNFVRGIIIDHIKNKVFNNINKIFKTDYIRMFLE